MNLNLTEKEFESLHSKYQTNDPEKFFNYKAFIANINRTAHNSVNVISDADADVTETRTKTFT